MYISDPGARLLALQENNPDALLQKKVDTESNVDPLFQKMCKAFDEGGARGECLCIVSSLGFRV